MSQPTHGMSKSRLYREWSSIKRRCYNQHCKDYERYGARGIYVCVEWKNSFEAFMEWALSYGYKDNLTIERKNVDGNYEPENCLWIPFPEQCRNRRSNRVIEYKGERKILSEWAEELGINRATLKNRLLYYGWSTEKAFTTPAFIGRNQFTEVVNNANNQG